MGKKFLYTIIGITSLVLILLSVILITFNTEYIGKVTIVTVLSNQLITFISSCIIIALVGINLILLLIRVGNINLKPVGTLYVATNFLLVLFSIMFLIGLIGETNFEGYINSGYQIIGIDKILNIIFLSIGMLLLIINLVISSNLYIQISSNVSVKQEKFSYQNPTELPTIDPEFTSSPNEQTFNIADKLAKLKENLNNGVFEEQIEEINNNLEQNSINNNIVQDIKQVVEEIEQPTKNNFENKNIAPTNKLPKESELEPILEPKDPYKQTIVPRRSAGKAREYNKPIGNVVTNISNQAQERRNAKYDSNYEGKVFLGDSDRIWEAMKKQERNFIKNASVKEAIEASNFANKILEEKEKTLEFSDLIDPINEEKTPSFDNPTIDWDD